MSAYGVTAQGFVPKTIEVIKADFEAAQQAGIDPQIDTSTEEPLGQLNGVYGAALAEVWEVVQTLSHVIDRDGAEGALLDNVGSATGSLRDPPKPSFVYANCTLTAANSPYVAGSLTANVNGQSWNQWHNAQDVIVGADGVVSVLFVSLTDGPNLAPSGQLNQISVAVTGWSAVTNPLDATPGNLLEDDADYRIRQEEELAAAGSCTVDAIRSDLLSIQGAPRAVSVLENTKMTVDAVTGMPPKSIQAIVYDGIAPSIPNNTIAQVMWDSKPAGVQLVGNTTGQAVDSQGNPQTVPFSRPTQRPVYLKYIVTFLPNAVPINVAAAIKAAVASLNYQATDENSGYQILPGSKVKAGVLRSIAEDIGGVDEVVSLALDFVPSPTNTSTLLLGPTEIGTLDTSRITVNDI